MLIALTLLALSVAPGIFLAIVIYGKDKYEPEPKKLLLITFLLGGLSVIPASLIEYSILGEEIPFSNSYLKSAVAAFLVVALCEEGLKFLILRYFAFKRKDFNEPFDGIVYGAFIALGFATFENMFYVIENGFGTGIVRMFTAVPGHFFFGVIMGYYVGKAKFDQTNRFSLLLTGLLFAALLHGLYDFFLFQQRSVLLMLMAVAVLIYGFRLSKKAIKEMQSESMFRYRNQQEENFDDN